jgi:HK97 family phage major capsid protein
MTTNTQPASNLRRLSIPKRNHTAGPDVVPATPAAPTMSDITAAFNEMNAAVKAMREQNDKAAAERAKKGTVDVVTNEALDRANARITEMESEMERMTQAVASSQLAGSGTRAGDAETAAYSNAFQAWMGNGREEQNLRTMNPRAALETQSDPDGGFMVPESMDAEITRVQGIVSSMRRLARVIPVSGMTHKKLHNLGGAGSGWVGEKEARPETDTPTLSELEFPTMELYANPAATQSILDDAQINMEQWLADEVSIAFAEQEAPAFITGSGAKRPRGFQSYTNVENGSYAWGNIGFKVSGVSAALSDSSNNGSDALLDVVYALKAGYRVNASWLCNDLTVAAMRKLKDENGAYLWQPGMAAGEPGMVHGYPVATDDSMPDIGANAFPIAFGDFRRGYLIVDRAGVRVLRDPYTNKPYVMFYTTKRVGGGVQDFAAIKQLKISA